MSTGKVIAVAKQGASKTVGVAKSGNKVIIASAIAQRQGQAGPGVSTGGTTGQVLAKASGTDYDTEWVDQAAGGGAVDSVNGQTGVVVLTQDNVADGTTNKAYTATEKTKLSGIATGATANDTDANLKARANHTGTQTASTISDFSTAADARITAATGVSVQGYSANTTTLGNTTTGTGSIVRATSPAITTPTGIVKGDVGLGNVDNTSDANKPVSTATQTALNAKLNTIGDQTIGGSLTAYVAAATKVLSARSGDNLQSISLYHTGTYGQIESTTSFVLASASGTTAISTGAPQLRVQYGAGSFRSITLNHDDTDGTVATSAGDLILSPASGTVRLNAVDSGITVAGITNEPSAPPAGNLRLYVKGVSGRMLLKMKGPSGVDTPIQPALFGNNIVMWSPTSATAGLWYGSAGAGAGTFSTALPTDTNIYTSTKRARWANVVTTTNQVLGQRNTEAMFYRGSSVSGAGGFFFYARFGFDVWTNGSRLFAGMHSATTVVSADPSALNNTVGFCVDAADNGAISFLTRGTSATKASTGMTITSNSGYDVTIFCAPGSSEYSWRIIELVTGTVASGVATANLPTNNTKLTAGVLASNGALTTVTATQLGINRIYVETDY